MKVLWATVGITEEGRNVGLQNIKTLQIAVEDPSFAKSKKLAHFGIIRLIRKNFTCSNIAWKFTGKPYLKTSGRKRIKLGLLFKLQLTIYQQGPLVHSLNWHLN